MVMEWLSCKSFTQLGIGSIIPAEPDPLALWALWIFILSFFGALFLLVITVIYIQRSDKTPDANNQPGINCTKPQEI
jgi:VIT1/CCC1 family predicted Fe2+/Mn2+ transporter